jgi:CRISPR-associated protein Cas2
MTLLKRGMFIDVNLDPTQGSETGKARPCIIVTNDVYNERVPVLQVVPVAKACKDYGQRVQYSVFECIVDPAQWAKFRDRLIDEIDPEKDSLRYYFLGSNWQRRIEHVGAKESLDQEGPLVI